METTTKRKKKNRHRHSMPVLIYVHLMIDVAHIIQVVRNYFDTCELYQSFRRFETNEHIVFTELLDTDTEYILY